MESNKALKKLAQTRLAERSRTFIHPSPNFESYSSKVELLQKICKNLPASQQAKCKEFEELLRQNSHSPEFASRRAVRHSTLPLLNKRCETISDDTSITAHHYQNFFEIELNALSMSQNFIYNVYIGGLAEANDEALLIQNEIHGIITIGHENEPQKYSYVKNGYFMVPKSEKGFVKNALKAAYVPLEAMLNKGKVLVHSRDGHILAPALLIAFLMKKYNLFYSAAKDLILNGHPQILISSDLESQLKKVNH